MDDETRSDVNPSLEVETGPEAERLPDVIAQEAIQAARDAEAADAKKAKSEDAKAPDGTAAGDEPAGEKDEAKPEGDEDETAKADAEDDADGDEDEAKPKRKRRRRPSPIERQLRDENRALSERLERLEAAGREPPSPAPADAPKQEDYEDYAEFVAAKAKHEIRQEVAQQRAREEQEQAKRGAQAALNAAVETFVERCDDARERYPDFDDVVQSADLQLPGPVTVAMFEAENSADIAYHLSSNPATARKIARMNPTAAAMEIGRISAALAEATPNPKPRRPAKPTTTVSGSGNVPHAPEKMSMAEYRRFREQAG